MGFTSRSVAVAVVLFWLFWNLAKGLIKRHQTGLQQMVGALLRRLEGGVQEVLEGLLRRLVDTRHERNQNSGRHFGALGAITDGGGRGVRLTHGRRGSGHTGSLNARGRAEHGVLNLRRQGRRESGSVGTKPELWQAADDGDIVTVTRLLDTGRRVDETYKGWTPLMKAAEEGHCEIMVALLNARADIEARNKNGRTPLSFAATPSMGRKASVAAVQLLLEAGASVEHKDARGETARDRAVRDGYQESVDRIDAFVERETELVGSKQIDARIDAIIERRLRAFERSPEALESLRVPNSVSTFRSAIASTIAPALDVVDKEDNASVWSASSTILSQIECLETRSQSSLSPSSPKGSPKSARHSGSLSSTRASQVLATIRKDVSWG